MRMRTLCITSVLALALPAAPAAAKKTAGKNDVAFVAAVPAAADYVPDPSAPRSAIPENAQWNHQHIFPDNAAWEAELEALGADIPKLMEFKGRLGESSATLLDAMVSYDAGPWRLAFNVVNLTDKVQITQCLARGDCFYGQRRTFAVTGTHRF